MVKEEEKEGETQTIPYEKLWGQVDDLDYSTGVSDDLFTSLDGLLSTLLQQIKRRDTQIEKLKKYPLIVMQYIYNDPDASLPTLGDIFEHLYARKEEKEKGI